jgi:hypothetical protein
MGLGVVHFPYLSIRVRAGSIEVTKRYVSDPMCHFRITQHSLHD